jgi:hypothetical protein
MMRAPLLLAVSLGLGVAACGGGSGGSTPPTATPVGRAAPPTYQAPTGSVPAQPQSTYTGPDLYDQIQQDPYADQGTWDQIYGNDSSEP